MKFRTIQEALETCFGQENEKKIAVKYAGKQITYGEIACASSIVINKLRSLNTTEGMHVGVFSNNRIITLITAIGVFRMGCVFVPLDPVYPANKIKYLIEIAELAVMISEDDAPGEFLEQKGQYTINSLVLNEEMLFGSKGTHIYDNKKERKENDPLYIYFTTGTTGYPKPVVGRNIGLMHFIDWEITTFGLYPGIKISQLTSPSHDPFLRDVFTTLVSLGTICIPENRNIIL